MRIHNRNGVSVVDIGNMEIWDGADLALLRETLARLIDKEGASAVGVELSFVKYIPSGFFGMLFDWHDHGVSAWLYSPQPNIMNMLWFRRFFEHIEGTTFLLRDNPEQPARGDEMERSFESRAPAAETAQLIAST